MAEDLWLRERNDGIEFRVQVQPRASRNRLLGIHDGSLKLALTAPPVEGAANRLCCEFLAGLLRRPKSTLEVVAGHRSRRKTLRAAGLSAAAFWHTLRAAGVGTDDI